MGGVLGEQLLLERGDAASSPSAYRLVRFSMAANGAQALGDHDVGALEGLGHSVDLLKGGAGLGGITLGALDDLRHEVVALGVGQGDVHAKAGQQADQRLRAGQRLAVRGRISQVTATFLPLRFSRPPNSLMR